MTISSISSTKRCRVTKKSANAASCSAAGVRSRIRMFAITTTRRWNEWGKAMFVTPGIVVDGELVTTNLVDINLGIRILLGSSYYEDWVRTAKSSSRTIR